jgi:hypothetical protein
MKKKCANGGIVKKPMTMQEQLAQVRGKVRTGYQQGGPVYRQGSSFSDNPLSGQPMQGIAAPVQAPMPAQLQPTQNQSALNGIPAKPVATMGATAIQSGSGAINSLGKADYSTGPRQGGFVNEDGTPRDMRPTGISIAEVAKKGQAQISEAQRLPGLSDRQRAIAMAGVANQLDDYGIKTDLNSAIGSSANGLSQRQKLALSQSQFGSDLAADRATARGIAQGSPVNDTIGQYDPNQLIQSQPGIVNRRQRRQQGFASGGPVFRKDNTFSDRPLMPEPGNYPQRIANPRPMPRPAAAQPVRIPLPPPEYPQERARPASSDSGAPAGTYQGVTGIADEIRKRKVKNAEAADYACGGAVKRRGMADGGMVESEDEGESEDKNNCSIEISIDIPVGDKKEKQSGYKAGGMVKHGECRKPGYAAGGMVKFAGPGGPRDDKIPVKVAGAEINVSDGENAVILPAKTAANPAAIQAINGIIQATNDGRKPRQGIASGVGYAQGGGILPLGVYPYDGKKPPTAEDIYRDVSLSGMVDAVTPATWKAAKVTAPPGSVGGGMSSSGTDPRDIPEGGTITNLAPALSQIHQFAKPAYDLSPSMRALQSTASRIGQVFSDSAKANLEGKTYQDIQAERAKVQETQRSAESKRQAIDNASKPVEGIAQAAMRPAQQPADSGAIQRNGLTTTQMGAGFDPTQLTMAPGYGMASNAAGKTISVGPSQYVAADGSPTSRWEDTRDYKDAIARNERDKIRLAEMQAVRLGANPQQALQASQGIAQAAQQSGQAAQQAGQAQQVQQFAIDKAAREQSLIDAWDKAETPEQKQAIAGQLKIMRGQQDKEGQFKDAVEEVVDEKTGQVIKRPVIYNASTGQPAGQTKAASEFSKADVDAAIKGGADKAAIAARIRSLGQDPKNYGL